MSKSSKRIKLENEIFSKSIKDIELMFNFSYDQEINLDSKRKLSKTSRSDGVPTAAKLEQKIPKVQLDLPTGLGVKHIEVDYDCINMSFFSDPQSESDEEAPFFLAPNQFVSAPAISAPHDMATVSRQNFADTCNPSYSMRNSEMAGVPPSVLLDLNDDDEIDGYSFGSDLKSYLPRMNLESDLKRIDQMFAAPSLLTKIS